MKTSPLKATCYAVALFLAGFGFGIVRGWSDAPSRPIPAAVAVMAAPALPVVAPAAPTIAIPKAPRKAIALLGTGVSKNAAFVNAVGRAAFFGADYKQLGVRYVHGIGTDGQGMPLEYWVCELLVELPPGYEEMEPIAVEPPPLLREREI